MDTDDLALFLRAWALGSVSAAGRDVRMSPAAASARLQTLERKLGTRLLHRTTRRLTLTEDGAAFLPHAQALVEGAEAAEAALSDARATPRGALRIAAPASFGRMHVAPALPDFLGLHPDVTLDLRLSDNMVDLVAGGFDAAIRNVEPTESSLIGRKLAPDRRGLVASPDYLRRRGVPQSPEDLAEHDCLIVGAQDVWTFRGPDGEATIKARGRLRIDDGGAVRDAAVAGLGIALMSTWAAGEEMRRGVLVPVLSDRPSASDHGIWAFYPSARLLSPKVRAFVDFFAARFGPTPYWDE